MDYTEWRKARSKLRALTTKAAALYRARPSAELQRQWEAAKANEYAHGVAGWQ